MYTNVMIFLALVILIFTGVGLWQDEHDRHTQSVVSLIIALVVTFLFVVMSLFAESDHELKHAAEHRAVQEQVESIQNF